MAGTTTTSTSPLSASHAAAAIPSPSVNGTDHQPPNSDTGQQQQPQQQHDDKAHANGNEEPCVNGRSERRSRSGSGSCSDSSSDSGESFQDEHTKRGLNPIAQYSQQIAHQNMHIHKVSNHGVEWREHHEEDHEGLPGRLGHKVEVLVDKVQVAVNHGNKKTVVKNLLNGKLDLGDSSEDDEGGQHRKGAGQRRSGSLSSKKRESVKQHSLSSIISDHTSSPSRQSHRQGSLLNGDRANGSTPPSESGTTSFHADPTRTSVASEQTSTASSSSESQSPDPCSMPVKRPPNDSSGLTSAPVTLHTSTDGSFPCLEHPSSNQPSTDQHRATSQTLSTAANTDADKESTGRVADDPAAPDHTRTADVRMFLSDAQPSQQDSIDIPSSAVSSIPISDSRQADTLPTTMTTAISDSASSAAHQNTTLVAPQKSPVLLRINTGNAPMIPRAAVIPPTPPTGSTGKDSSESQQQSPSSPTSYTRIPLPSPSLSKHAKGQMSPGLTTPASYFPSSPAQSGSTSSNRSSAQAHKRSSSHQPTLLSSSPLSYTTSAPSPSAGSFPTRRSSLNPASMPSTQSNALPSTSYLNPAAAAAAGGMTLTSMQVSYSQQQLYHQQQQSQHNQGQGARKRSSTLSPIRALSFRNITGVGRGDSSSSSFQNETIYDEPMSYEELQMQQLREEQLNDSIARQAEKIRKERLRKTLQLQEEQKAMIEESLSTSPGTSAGLNAITALDRETGVKDRGPAGAAGALKGKDRERNDSGSSAGAFVGHPPPLSPSSPTTPHAQLFSPNQNLQQNQAVSSAVAGSKEGVYATPAAKGDLPEQERVLVGNLIGEDHVNYVLMYNMLTGIRIGVSGGPTYYCETRRHAY